MTEPLKFDASAVADRARQLKDMEVDIEALRIAAKRADDDLRSAETRLGNLRAEFTRMVSPHLDAHTIDQHVKRGRAVPA